MKKYAFLIIVVLAVIFTSCGDKKADSTANSASAVLANEAKLKSELTAKKGDKAGSAPTSDLSSSLSSSLAASSKASNAVSSSSNTSASSSAKKEGNSKAASSVNNNATSLATTNSANSSAQPSTSTSVKVDKAEAVVAPNAEEWPSTFATITPKNGGGVQLFVLKTPSDWHFDSLSTYSKNKIKTCEILSVTQNPDGNTFPAELLKKYNVEQAKKGDYGLVEKTDGNLGEHKFRSYLFFAKPLDAEAEYHVYFTLVNINGFTLELAFYTNDDTSEKIVPVINEIIENIKYIDVYNYKKEG